MSDILSSIGRAFNGIIPDTGNQFLDGMLITGLLSIITLMLRSIPRRIGALVIRYFSTEMMLTSAQISFHDFMKWLEKNGHSTRSGASRSATDAGAIMTKRPRESATANMSSGIR